MASFKTSYRLAFFWESITLVFFAYCTQARLEWFDIRGYKYYRLINQSLFILSMFATISSACSIAWILYFDN